MPELAEVETFRIQLEPVLIGKCITGFIATHPRSTRRHLSAHEIADAVVGREVSAITRHGKYLAIECDDVIINVHLRMSGRFVVVPLKTYDEKSNPDHTHIVITTDQHAVLFVDPRTFGEMWLTHEPTEEISRGIDAVDSTVEQRYEVLSSLGKSTRNIKTVLLDQNVIAGIGNIYADETLADAHIAPTRKMCNISEEEFVIVSKSMSDVLCAAIDNRGSSLRDKSFRDLHGNLGSQQKFHRVHDRAGKPCETCGAQIIKSKVAGRGTYYCPNCQK